MYPSKPQQQLPKIKCVWWVLFLQRILQNQKTKKKEIGSKVAGFFFPLSGIWWLRWKADTPLLEGKTTIRRENLLCCCFLPESDPEAVNLKTNKDYSVSGMTVKTVKLSGNNKRSACGVIKFRNTVHNFTENQTESTDSWFLALWGTGKCLSSQANTLFF